MQEVGQQNYKYALHVKNKYCFANNELKLKQNFIYTISLKDSSTRKKSYKLKRWGSNVYYKYWIDIFLIVNILFSCTYILNNV